MLMIPLYDHKTVIETKELSSTGLHHYNSNGFSWRPRAVEASLAQLYLFEQPFVL